MAIEGQKSGIESVEDADTIRAGELALEAMVRMGLTNPDSTKPFTETEQSHYDSLLVMFLGEMSAGPVDGG